MCSVGWRCHPWRTRGRSTVYNVVAMQIHAGLQARMQPVYPDVRTQVSTVAMYSAEPKVLHAQLYPKNQDQQSKGLPTQTSLHVHNHAHAQGCAWLPMRMVAHGCECAWLRMVAHTHGCAHAHAQAHVHRIRTGKARHCKCRRCCTCTNTHRIRTSKVGIVTGRSILAFRQNTDN